MVLDYQVKKLAGCCNGIVANGSYMKRGFAEMF